MSHHMHEDLESRPQILGDVNTGHIAGHLVPGVALTLAGMFMTSLVVKQVLQRKHTPLYGRVDAKAADDQDVEFQAGAVEDSQFFSFYSNRSRRKEHQTDSQRMCIGLAGLVLLLCGMLLEIGGSVYAGLGVLYQSEHLIIYSSYVPGVLCLLLESGKFRGYEDVVSYSPVPSQFFFALAFYANNLLWNTHLSSKKPGWDYDGHEIFVIITRGAFLLGMLFTLATVADHRKLAKATYLLTPVIGFWMNGAWLFTHVFVLIFYDVKDTKHPIQEAAYPLFVVEFTVIFMLYLWYIRRRYRQIADGN